MIEAVSQKKPSNNPSSWNQSSSIDGYYHHFGKEYKPKQMEKEYLLPVNLMKTYERQLQHIIEFYYTYDAK